MESGHWSNLLHITFVFKKKMKVVLFYDICMLMDSCYQYSVITVGK